MCWPKAVRASRSGGQDVRDPIAYVNFVIFSLPSNTVGPRGDSFACEYFQVVHRIS
jgi:hypothetical protein